MRLTSFCFSGLLLLTLAAGCVMSGGSRVDDAPKQTAPAKFETIATNVSGDGKILVGVVRNGFTGLKETTTYAVSWQDGQPTPVEPGWTRPSLAEDISRDGRVIVGIVKDTLGGSARAVKWRDGYCVGLGKLEGSYSQAVGVSADGSRVIVNSPDAEGVKACIHEKGRLRSLGTLGGSWSYAIAISGDGGTVVGTSPDAQGQRCAFVWRDGVMRQLGEGRGSVPLSISEDGHLIVVLDSKDAVAVLREGEVVWRHNFGTAALKARLVKQGTLLVVTVFGREIYTVNLDGDFELHPLSEYLAGRGVQNVADWRFNTVNDISDDASVFVGYGRHGGSGISWTVRLAAGGGASSIVTVEQVQPQR